MLGAAARVCGTGASAVSLKLSFPTGLGPTNCKHVASYHPALLGCELRFSFLFSWSVAGTSYLLLSLGEFRTLRSKELEFSNIASSSSEYSSPNSNSM